MLFSALERLFAGDHAVYVEIDRRELRLLDGLGGKRLVIPAAVAVSLSKPRMIVAAGKEAAAGVPNGSTFWPFDHPRSVINDFQLAERLLQHALLALHMEPPSRRFRPRPIVILRSTEDWEGGLTQIERRALLELGYGALAREVFLWDGRPPTLQELKAGAFRQSAQAVKN
jgi:rod shape-determining protein MreB and related proteins